MLSDRRDSCPFLYPSCDEGSLCADCALLKESLEAARPVDRPIPSDLQSRLCDIPGLPSMPTERSVDDEIAACLEAASEDARFRHPMPDSLRRRLREIPATASREPADPLPWWIADSRWAMSACCLLTSALTLLAGDASARFQELQDSSSRIRQTTRSLTTDFGGHMTARLSQWVPQSSDEPVSSRRQMEETSWISVTADSGRNLLKATKDRASARTAPLIGGVHRQKEIFKLKADAWLGLHGDALSPLSRERWQELKRRTEEVVQLLLPEDADLQEGTELKKDTVPENSPADHPTKGTIHER